MIGLICGTAFTAVCEARADWTDYISDIGSVGIGVTKDVADVITKNKKLKTPLLDSKVGTIGNLLSFTQAVPEAVKRQQDYNLGLGQTIAEETLRL